MLVRFQQCLDEYILRVGMVAANAYHLPVHSILMLVDQGVEVHEKIVSHAWNDVSNHRQHASVPSASVCSTRRARFHGMRQRSTPIGHRSDTPEKVSPAPTKTQSASHRGLKTIDNSAPHSTNIPAANRTCRSSDHRVRVLETSGSPASRHASVPPSST